MLIECELFNAKSSTRYFGDVADDMWMDRGRSEAGE